MSSPSTTATAAPPALSRQQRVFTLTGVLLGMLLAALDQTIVATAGPAIQRDLGIPPSLYVWLTTAYLVSSTVMVPIYGKLSDVLGRKPILLVGVVVFLGGSLLCALSRSPAALIAARAVQGLGSASLFTSAFAVVADIFPPAVRGRYTGIFGGVWGLASVVGPLLGGVLTDRLSWHWVFLVNLPVGAVAIAFIALRMPRLRRPDAGPLRVDFAGALALVLAVVPLLFALSLGRSASGQPAGGGYWWGSWPMLVLLALAALGITAFVLVERRAADPLLDPRLFRNRVFAWGNAAVFTVNASFFAAIVFLPLFLVHVVGLSATGSGLTMTPLTLALVAGNVLSGQMVSRLGRYRGLMLGALALLAGAFAVMGLTLDVGSTQLGVTLKMILVGLGLGPSIPLYTLAIQNAVPPRQIGVATASATFFRQMGATVGVAVLGTVFASSLGGPGQGAGDAGREAFAAATRNVYLVSVGIVVLAAALTAAIPELPLRRSNA
jgi:EmrB/QacA subfamily drug resistance transporter